MVLFFCFPNCPFIGIDTVAFFCFFFVLELLKEAWECGYDNNNIKENGKAGFRY